MRCLLATNIVSEATRRQPDDRVLRWLEGQDAAETYISVLTIGEVEQGIARLGNTKRAGEFRAWVDDVLLEAYRGRILSLDHAVLALWGRATGEALKVGRTPPVLDSLLAATAMAHDLVLVTRDTGDVAMLPVRTFNPWEG